jgi:predicted phage baseplate assembly protein
MPISPPVLDDRNFEDLVEELLARIPAHTPEWVPQPGDPGTTMLELFAWLGETILYRANLVPERQRLAFLKLLGEQMRPAQAARGLVSIRIDEPDNTAVIQLAARSKISGAVDFESGSELTVLPVTAECYYKRPLTEDERSQDEVMDVLDGLREFHDIDGELSAYVTTEAFALGAAEKGGVDLVQDTTDASLWLALMARSPGQVDAVKNALAGDGEGDMMINIGVAPAIELPASFDEASRPGRLPHRWEISTDQLLDDQPVYSELERALDTTDELTKRGIERLVLPGNPAHFGVIEGDVRVDANAGVGDRPPRLDDPEKLARIVAWLRLRPALTVNSMPISWVGINALEIDQRQTIERQIIGQSSGSADQLMQLPKRAVEKETFALQVEEGGRYVDWQAVDDLALMARDDRVFRLDSEAGQIQFGNGISGRIPEAGQRVRVSSMRAGGGKAGNLPPASLNRIDARDLNGNSLGNRALRVSQGVATDGGEDAENLAMAEKRIPQRLRHRNRCVTAQDYLSLVAETPGVKAGRVEVLPRFLPQQRRQNVAGVVSVMVLPFKQATEAPNPRPDQPFIEKVFNHLDKRRPLATELYVIGCEYVQLGLSVGITINNGAAFNQVVNDVRRALKHYLWSLPPDGPNGRGWPLGKAVRDRELEVVVARVEGVSTVPGINIFRREDDAWSRIERAQVCDSIELVLKPWQLPELLGVVVSTDGIPSDEMRSVVTVTGGTAVPIIPVVC